MNRAPLLLPALALLVAGVGPARAGMLYDNGPVSAPYGGFEITNGFAVSNSFTIPNVAQLTEARVGLWVYSGSQPISVQWSIGASPFSSDFGSGTATLTNSFYGKFNNLLDTYQSTFPLSGTLAAGQYWLTLQNASATNSPVLPWTVYWIADGGPSMSQQSTFGTYDGTMRSESFQIYGTTTVPEPASMTLLGIGIAGLVGHGWRRRK